MNVPLWLYVATTFGVALLGVGGVVFTAWNSARMIEKQIERDRERAEEERSDAHARWIREQRVQAYTRCLATIDDLVIRGATGEIESPIANNMRNVFSEVGLWSGPEVHEALTMLSSDVTRLQMRWVPEGQGEFDLSLTLTDINARAHEFRDAARREIGLEPFEDWALRPGSAEPGEVEGPGV